jgi:hypothetical protein
MALLTDPERGQVTAQLQTDLSRQQETVTLAKSELRAAVNAADQWAEDNATAFNQALPQPARSNLTAKQKARVLSYVLYKRYEVT